MSSHRSLIVVLVALLCGVAAAPASANPGFEPLGGPQIGLPGGNQARGALAVHHGRLYVDLVAAPPGPASDGAIVMSYVRDAAPGRRVAAAVRYSP